MRNLFTRTARTVAAAALCVTVLAACGGNDDSATQAESVTVSDQWVKAADSGMTAAFGQLANTGNSEVHLVSVSSPASGFMEIHEMATSDTGGMVMREKDGGLVIPAKGSHSLDPGGDHLMFMDITAPVTAGQTVDITLTFDDGSTKDIEAQVRDFSGNEENYDPGTTDMPMPDHDMMPSTPSAPNAGA
ncbi:hypothetical protein DFR67_106188 [Williamsia limnetica]|uniref:Copper(I)-binding protein n=1 Tax=Williamsia limnetica TaxID=882452 RepID=A0A318RMD8_WILLI|nr:copper chaperone PCu(A)C [Williamsia limnetica]PYE17485.1 hypothetical protein DFR67_106188 [Williamsia limnetica]